MVGDVIVKFIFTTLAVNRKFVRKNRIETSTILVPHTQTLKLSIMTAPDSLMMSQNASSGQG